MPIPDSNKILLACWIPWYNILPISITAAKFHLRFTSLQRIKFYNSGLNSDNKRSLVPIQSP